MFCSKCGNEIDNEAVICPKCGCKTANYVSEPEVKYNEPDEVSRGLVAVSILIPLIGVILGIVYLCKKKTKSGTAYLLAGAIAWVVYIVILSIL